MALTIKLLNPDIAPQTYSIQFGNAVLKQLDPYFYLQSGLF